MCLLWQHWQVCLVSGATPDDLGLDLQSCVHSQTQELLGLQVFFQIKYFIPDPIQNDVKYQASAQPFLVFGLLTTGLAIGHHNAVL